MDGLLSAPHSTPYGARPNRRGDTWHDRERIHVTVRRDKTPTERGGAGTSQDGTSKNWFKITVSAAGREAGDLAWGGGALSTLLCSQGSALSPGS